VDVVVDAVDVDDVVVVVVVDVDGDTAAVACWVQLHKTQPWASHRLPSEDLKLVPQKNPCCAQGCPCPWTALKQRSSVCSLRRWS